MFLVSVLSYARTILIIHFRVPIDHVMEYCIKICLVSHRVSMISVLVYGKTRGSDPSSVSGKRGALSSTSQVKDPTFLCTWHSMSSVMGFNVV